MPRLAFALTVLALVLAAAWFLRSGESDVVPRAAAPEAAVATDAADLRDVEAQASIDAATSLAVPSAQERTPADDAARRRARFFHVLDRIDERHLAGIEVRHEDEFVSAGLASPFELDLDLGDSAPAALWIGAEGYLPFRFVVPERSVSEELWVHLERASGLELRVIGAPAALESARVRLYGPALAPVELGSEWRAERPAATSLRFPALEPGGWCVTLEERVGERELIRWAIVAQAQVELAPGEWRALVLEAQSVEDALAPAVLTLRFPSSWSAEPSASARLDPRSGNARRLGERHVLDALGSETWGPIGLVPGPYALVLEPGRIELPIDLAPGERRDLRVPEVAWCDVSIRFLDSDGAPADLDWFGWRAMLGWDGRPATGRAPGMRTMTSERPLRLRAATAPLELMLSKNIRESFRRVVVHPCGARELEVRLRPDTRVELELAGLEGELDREWLMRVRATLDGDAVVAVGRSVTSDGERSIAALHLEHAGALVLEFPPLASHGSLRTRSVSVREGETLRISLGPADLASAAKAR